jgi:hypothetical protein
MKKGSNIIMLAMAILLAVPMYHGGDWLVKNPQSPSERWKFSYELDTDTGNVLILGSTGTGATEKKYEEARRPQGGPGPSSNLLQQQQQKPEGWTLVPDEKLSKTP